LLELERVARKVEQRQVSFASRGLGARQEKIPTDALELLADLDRPGVEIDILPAQAQSFVPSQAVEDEQNERDVQRIGLGSSQKS
jgi:hypothetical protein